MVTWLSNCTSILLQLRKSGTKSLREILINFCQKALNTSQGTNFKQVRYDLETHKSHAQSAFFRYTKPAAVLVKSRSQAGAMLAPPVLIRWRISINTHLLPARGLDANGRAGAGCELEASTKAAPHRPIFVALTPPPLECSPDHRRAGTKSGHDSS